LPSCLSAVVSAVGGRGGWQREREAVSAAATSTPRISGRHAGAARPAYGDDDGGDGGRHRRPPCEEGGAAGGPFLFPSPVAAAGAAAVEPTRLIILPFQYSMEASLICKSEVKLSIA
ncbi:Os06g0634700, partial [Oryza sativa Japonica Group]